MSGAAEWLPPQILLSDYGGDPKKYLDAVYDRFCEDLVSNKVSFRGRTIAVRRHPPSDGKEFGFWHCISEGAIETDRTPDLERCARVGWIKAIIENVADSRVDVWPEERGGRTDHILWYNEEYVIVLSERGRRQDGSPDAYLLKTAFRTPYEHQKRKKRRARDASKKANAAPKDGV